MAEELDEWAARFAGQFPFNLDPTSDRVRVNLLGIELRSAIAQARQMTASIYSGDISISEVEDPEIVGDRHFVVRVVDSGSMDELMARYHEWHSRLSVLPQHLRLLFCLNLDVRANHRHSA